MPGHLSRKPLQCPNCGANVDEQSVRCAYCKAVLSQTACPACFAPIFKGMRFCPHCGHSVERDDLADAGTGDGAVRPTCACPRCARPLESASIGETPIDECTVCGGIWLDAETFEAICADRERQEAVLAVAVALPAVPAAPPAAPPTAPPAAPPTATTDATAPARMYVPCPVCGELMNRRNFAGCSGVIIDWCKPHGFWFDRQELQRIVDFIRDGGLQKARAREMAALEAARRDLRDQQFAINHERLNMLQNGPVDRASQDILTNVLVHLFKRLI